MEPAFPFLPARWNSRWALRRGLCDVVNSPPLCMLFRLLACGCAGRREGPGEGDHTGLRRDLPAGKSGATRALSAFGVPRGPQGVGRVHKTKGLRRPIWWGAPKERINIPYRRHYIG